MLNTLKNIVLNSTNRIDDFAWFTFNFVLDDDVVAVPETLFAREGARLEGVTLDALLVLRTFTWACLHNKNIKEIIARLKHNGYMVPDIW